MWKLMELAASAVEVLSSIPESLLVAGRCKTIPVISELVPALQSQGPDALRRVVNDWCALENATHPLPVEAEVIFAVELLSAHVAQLLADLPQRQGHLLEHAHLSTNVVCESRQEHGRRVGSPSRMLPCSHLVGAEVTFIAAVINLLSAKLLVTLPQRQRHLLTYASLLIIKDLQGSTYMQTPNTEANVKTV